MSRTLNRRRVTLLGAGVLFALQLITASPATAHAELVEAIPSAGAVLVNAPEVIVLHWNEAVATSAGQLTLIDYSGEITEVTVEAGDAVTEATITPVKALSDGRWTVSWKAVSGDGHLVSGAYSFTVGDVASGVDAAAPGQSGSAVGAEDRVLETLSWTALLFSLGAYGARRRRLALAAAAVTLVAVLIRVQLFVDAFGAGYGATLSSVGETRSAAAVGVGAVAMLFAVAVPRRVAHFAAGVALGGFVAQGLFSGHHLDFDHGIRIVAMTAHLAHLFAGAVWVSAVISMLFDRSAEQLRQVSRLATIAVAVLFPSAFTLAILLGFPVGTPDGTAWLVNLVFKSAIVGVAFALGAVHHRAVLRGGQIGYRTVVAELLVMTAVFGASATLTQYTPPAIAVASSAPVPAPEELAPADLAPVVGTLDDGSRVTLSFSGSGGARDGMWMLDLRTSDGAPLSAQAVQATASNSEAGLEDLPVVLTGAADHWMGTNSLPFPGRWQISIAVFLDEFTVVNAELRVDIQDER
jgi:methionine-rich copper-binding protein CopC